MLDGSRLSTERIAPLFQHRMTDTTFRLNLDFSITVTVVIPNTPSEVISKNNLEQSFI